MKHFIITATISLVMISSCKSRSILSEKSISKIEKISLSERTRGTIRDFTLSNGKLESSINGNIDSQELSQNDWSKIVEYTEEINAEGISKLGSPSTKRYSDAALASHITITKNGTDHQSSTFDSGNPPAELKDLYNEVQRIIKTKKSR
ncbi:hypothetical protein [Chryseobacterium sp. NKUCC03_KSP]|uniref:hypothetical protein n=1 Tax=Chryseobacterium sp. NKUCC03_KSP TaxID=2842125 RepID=UPI001C5AD2CD|nr:hypothetical protein [Chryseobacterium sp. NKUCC03_KSP]MBW3523017.1 hypothetical protein [Chryseobacterium sp. NKUCC03_KSP]